MSKELLTNKYFKMYANCIPVKGASRSIICDVQRGRYDFITNDLYEILKERKNLSIAEVFNFYGLKNREILEEYFIFLLSEHYIFLCDQEELKLFPEIDLFWDNPSVITNAIIDSDANSTHDFTKIFLQLASLGCKAVQLRFFNEITLSKLSPILSLLETSTITSIEIILPFPKDASNDDEIIVFANSHLRLSLIILHSATQTKIINEKRLIGTRVILTEEQINNESHCGMISKAYFSINIDTFSEAQLHNSCLNRKISVDKNGEIKNCPAMDKSYGNINTVTLNSVTKLENFLALGSINKDQIEICKDCEFRYICTDCRAFRATDNLLSKPAKCRYNPYEETWDRLD